MQSKQKRILICIDWYEPGFKAGGPIRSVANIVSALKNEFEFYVLTSAFDLGETEPYEGIELNQWHDRDGVFIKYMDRRALTPSSIAGNIREIEPDLLYLNSLFSKVFTLVPLIVARRMGVKVVLAPRGMLGQGALDIKKGKKKFFIRLAKLLRLYSKVKWHASTREEASEVYAVFGKNAKVVIAQNIAVAQSKRIEEILDKKNTGIVRFVFASRISAKKNLDIAIRAIKQVSSGKKLFLDIYGHLEDTAYFETFSSALGTYGNLIITYKGAVSPDKIAEIYASADFMVLPTRHENYGHAIVEAWANGCPVIISRNTPWKNLRTLQLGWDVDIQEEKNLVQAMQAAIDMDFTSYLAMVRACYNYFGEKISDPKVVEANRKLFEE